MPRPESTQSGIRPRAATPPIAPPNLESQKMERPASRSESKAVVNELAVFRNETVAQMHHFAIHRQRFHLPMREMQNRAAGSLINTAPFHSNETILDNVNAADAMFTAELVQRLHHAERRKL